MRFCIVITTIIVGCGDDGSTSTTREPETAHSADVVADPSVQGDVHADDQDAQATDTSSDPETSRPPEVTLTGACLEVRPEVIDFGSRPPGETFGMLVEFWNCGELVLEINSLTITAEPGDDRFELDPAAIADLPFTIPRDGARRVMIIYTPAAILTLEPEPDRAQLHIRSNATPPETTIDVLGVGRPVCPTPRIVCDREGPHLPATPITCSASTSTDGNNGPVSRYLWILTQPPGSSIELSPSADVEEVTFTPTVLGHYTLSLDVWDHLDVKSCTPAGHELSVLDRLADVYVDVEWRTPGDADETDSGTTLGGVSVGSDVDLHVRHPHATTWFDERWDAYWLNPTPEWASAGTEDDPMLARDDTDGAGPEVFVLSHPEEDKTYTVGVHYWDDWGYGPALATVRVYIRGELQFKWADVDLVTRDLWSVCEIDWPSGEVRALGGDTPQIEANYPVPLNSGWPF